jgi:hypothetical protein
MMATTMGGSTMGIRNTVRSASRSRVRMLSSRARPSPIRSCNSTVQNESLICTQIELWKRVSAQSWW